jgi:hypothetical protein
MMRVTGGVVGIYLEPTPRYDGFTPARAPTTRRIAAYAYYSDGSSRSDITQSIVFTSSNPDIVETPNEPGDRGKLLVVGSGTARITATDPVSGVTSSTIYLRGLDDLRDLVVPAGYPNTSPSAFVYDVGNPIFFWVFGRFPDGSALLTDGIELVSHDLTIAAPDASGRLVGLKPGVVTISAVDTATGISTADSGNDVTVTVRGPLQRLTIEPPVVKRLVGQSEFFLVLAHYEGGYQEPISSRVELRAADPTVAEVASQIPLNRAIAAHRGSTTISARDPVSGVSTTDTGDDATFTVLGALVSIAVKPVRTVRAPGRSYFFAAIGTDESGETLNLTQLANFSSSDPTVASVGYWNAGNRLDTLAAGTTFMSAKEPLSGITSTASGGDAQIDVIGALTRLVITSEVVSLQAGDDWQVTATGRDATNRSANLTQEVTYASSDPSIVAVTNEDGHRSRIVAVAPGIAAISARDPVSNLTSTASGGDLLITVTGP